MLMMVRTPLPSSPTRQANASANSTSDEAFERLPSLSFRRWKCSPFTDAVGPKTRHQKAGQSALRLRQHQKSVAHRRRHEPFVAGDGIALARGLGARRVGAHVGAALPLGHAHAERDAGLLPPRPEMGIVTARHDLGAELRCERGLDRERRDRGARHGDRAEMSGLDLRRHVEARGAGDLRRRRRRRRVVAPGRAVQAGRNALGHEMVIGRMELDEVAAKALGVEGFQLRRVLVRLPREVEHLAVPQRRPNAESAAASPVAAFRRDRVLQRPVAGIEIDVHIGR